MRIHPRTATVAVAVACLGVLGSGVGAVLTTSAVTAGSTLAAGSPPPQPSPSAQRVSEELQQLLLGLENKPGGVGPTSAVVEILGNIAPSQL